MSVWLHPSVKVWSTFESWLGEQLCMHSGCMAFIAPKPEGTRDPSRLLHIYAWPAQLHVLNALLTIVLWNADTQMALFVFGTAVQVLKYSGLNWYHVVSFCSCSSAILYSSYKYLLQNELPAIHHQSQVSSFWRGIICTPRWQKSAPFPPSSSFQASSLFTQVTAVTANQHIFHSTSWIRNWIHLHVSSTAFC